MAVPFSRKFRILAPCVVGSDVKCQALAAGLVQNRSLWRLSLSEFGSNLWGPWPPGLQAPVGVPLGVGCGGGRGGQALEEAEKIKQEWGDDFEIWWQLGAQKGPKYFQYELPSDDMIHDSI